MFRFTITYTGSTVLSVEPRNWKQIETSFTRSEQYFGIFYTVVAGVEFLCQGGGGDIIQEAWEAEGTEAEVLLDIEYQCSPGDAYEMIMNGRLDMATYQVENYGGPEVVICDVVQDDINNRIMSRDDATVNLKSLVGLDGQALTYYTGADTTIEINRTLEIVGEVEANNTGNTISDTWFAVKGENNEGLWQPSMDAIKNDLIQMGVNGDITNFDTTGGVSTGFTNSWYLDYGDNFRPIFNARATQVQAWPSDISIDFSIDIYWEDMSYLASGLSNKAAEIYFRVFAGPSVFEAWILGPVYSQLIDSYNSTAATVESGNYSDSGTINISNFPENWSVWAFINVHDWSFAGSAALGTNTAFDFICDEWSWEITSDNEVPASSSECCLIHEAFSRTLESITGNTVACYSEIFGRKDSSPISYSDNGCGSFTAVTSGLNLRGYIEKGINVTLQDLFKSCDSIWNIGLGVELYNGSYVARIEEKAYFFDTTEIITIQGIRNVEWRLWEEELYNQVEIGFDKWQPFAVSGLDEPLTVQEYVNRNKNVRNTLDLKSPYIVAMNLIEIMRRQTEEREQTKDTPNDEDIFLVATNRSVDAVGVPTDLGTAEYAENFNTTIGFTQPGSALNLRFSPKRNLIRHMNRLAASIYRFAGDVYRFTKGEGNQDMATVMDADGCPGDYQADGLSTVLDEDGNIAWDDPAIRNNTPLYIPELYRFDVPLSYSQWEQIEANPKGVVVGVLPDGTEIRGFLKEMRRNLATGTASFELIREYGN